MFNNTREDLEKEYENADKNISKYCGYIRVYTLVAQQWHLEEILKELKTLTVNDLYVPPVPPVSSSDVSIGALETGD